MIQRGKALRVRAFVLAGSAVSLCPTVALAQSTGGDQSAVEQTGSQSTGVEDIVVTAQKREQNLQDVPISITALSSTALEANRVLDVRDLSALAPNLTIRVIGGGGQAPTYTMRGLVTGGTAAGSDKGVSLYLDGVYLQNVTGSVFQLADIERIEVLKGPQGTLFGRNATGGAISIITRNPTGEFGVKQELSYGNYDQLRSKTHVDLPKFGPFSISGTYLHSERRGDTRNLGAGTVWDYSFVNFGKKISPKYLGDENIEAGTVAVKADLHPDLDLIYKFDYSQNNFTPTAQGAGFLQPGFLTTLYNAQNPALRTPITTRRPKAVNDAFTIPSKSKSYGHNLTAKYQVNDEISFKNILSYRKSMTRGAFQLDGLGGLRNSLSVPGVGAFPVDATASQAAPYIFIANNINDLQRQWSNEFQININTDWFDLTAGYLHFHVNVYAAGFDDSTSSTVSRGLAGQNTPLAGTLGAVIGDIGYRRAHVVTNSDAFFLQPEIHITDHLDIVAGARITKDRKEGLEHIPNQAAARAAGRPLSNSLAYRGSQATYLAGINYRPTDDILVYGKFATGFISGGSLATITYLPEFAESFEGGIKADLFDRRFRSNLAVFHVDYKNIQQATAGSLTGVPSAFFFGTALQTAADAKAKGFEWENTLVPVDGVTLTANVGYTDFKFDQSTLFPGLADRAGVPGYLPFQRPKWSGGVSGQYETPEILRGGRLVLRADANFQSKIFHAPYATSQVANDPISPFYNPALPTLLRSQILRDPILAKAMTTPFQWIVNARVALADLEFGRAKATVALWGRNIFDNDRLTGFIGLGPVGSTSYERARTYGIDVSFDF